MKDLIIAGLLFIIAFLLIKPRRFKKASFNRKTIIELLLIARNQFDDGDKLALFMAGLKEINMKNLLPVEFELFKEKVTEILKKVD